MKKLLIFLLLSGGYAQAQKIYDYGLERVRITDENKTIQLEVKPVSGKQVTNPNLWYSWYSADRLQTTQGGYSGKLLNGAYKSYYPNKNLMEEGQFDAGLRQGVWKSWKENGVLIQFMTWKRGIMNGSFSKYDDTGNLLTSGTYKKGLIDGPLRQQAGKDSVITTWYKNGMITRHQPLWKRVHLFRKKIKN